MDNSRDMSAIYDHISALHENILMLYDVVDELTSRLATLEQWKDEELRRQIDVALIAIRRDNQRTRDSLTAYPDLS
jgi:ElaB/YqjD/DUF883 family membrane-anchored ribosome-binding protein